MARIKDTVRLPQIMCKESQGSKRGNTLGILITGHCNLERLLWSQQEPKGCLCRTGHLPLHLQALLLPCIYDPTFLLLLLLPLLLQCMLITGKVSFLFLFFIYLFFYYSMNFITFIVIQWSSQLYFIALLSQTPSMSPHLQTCLLWKP